MTDHHCSATGSQQRDRRPHDAAESGSNATAARTAALEALVADLAGATIGSTFNQYRQSGGADRDRSAPDVRRANLTAQLRAHATAPVLAVAEAAGWRGARYSGLCLLSERLIDEATSPYRRTSSHPLGFAEASATVVQRALGQGGWRPAVLLWNTVPTHPAGAVVHSNRAPRAAEVAAGAGLLRRLLAIVEPRHVIAIGGVARGALSAGMEVRRVRHPAQGGAALCHAQLVAALDDLLG